MPASPEAIEARSILDITHESFLRQWQRLKGWIDVEAKSVESYRLLEQSARHWKQGRAALWGTPNLEMALAMAFLEASEQAQRLALRYKRARVIINLSLVALLAAGAGWQWLEAQAHTRRANDERTQAEHNLEAARAAATQASNIAQKLAQQDPGNAEWQRDPPSVTRGSAASCKPRGISAERYGPIKLVWPSPSSWPSRTRATPSGSAILLG